MVRLVHEKLLISDKKRLFYRILTLKYKVKIFRVLHDYVSLLMRRCSERGTRNREQIIFRKAWTRYIQNFNHFLMTQKELD